MLNFISLRFSSKYDSYNRSILLSYTIHVWLSSLQVTVTCKPLRSGLKIFKETCWGTTFGDRNSWITWWWETKNSLKQRHSTRDLPFYDPMQENTLYIIHCYIIFAINETITKLLYNPLHPNISMHILHTVQYTFPKVMTRRICATINSWWSFPLFSWP